MDNKNIIFEENFSEILSKNTAKSADIRENNIENIIFERCNSEEDSPSVENKIKTKYSYKALKIIGYGSFGVVFLAEEIETKEKIAIKKVLREKGNKSREISILKHLSHPNIVKVRNHFTTKSDENSKKSYF